LAPQSLARQEKVLALTINHLVSLLISIQVAIVYPKSILDMEKSAFYEGQVNGGQIAILNWFQPLALC
jgi:hypothetical protein